MGAWGVGNFENDSALDWMHDFLESEDKMTILKKTFKMATRGNGFFGKLFRRSPELEEPEAAAVLAAGEVISLLLGKPATELPDELIDWASKNRLNLTIGLVNDALSVIGSVRKNSELKFLWEETDEYHSWLKEVTDLENRLRP
ncbi:DUF4259 domain-containing protein [Ammoniphilus sp. YIM 78166]|uniref:DUF4259 domain-containing protein n=1 Tax=Ammoniphilus sp. YIM 78166 TaxID=1644106 RepID=UPI00106FDDDB|nr:DUF4259 domain-containing protein [Ammoniphilus sp. YIM 78166]